MSEKSALLVSVFRASHVHLGLPSAYDELAGVLNPDEQPICALKVRSLWIEGELVTGRPPILLLTTENVVVEKINPAGAFQKVKTGFDVFPLSSITKLSSLEKGFFEFQLNDGRSIRARRIGSWTGIKDSQKFHDALTSALAHA